MRKTKEQKEIAVKRYLFGRKEASAIIIKIGISRSTLYLWIKQYRDVQSDKGKHYKRSKI